ncbi:MULTISPECIES: hypothetical protein [Bacillales]|uniref:Aspartyl/asparaginyl-tRNA synthetase n=1 Tax=Lysinibacillus louembei TaxID=1470088 RepID=A0ABZ0S2T8_9BACI|nr:MULTISPECIES: hypothetical protein [Bacillales]MCT6925518.1 hypothetical protein [Metasolibacillus sp.]MCT6941680.1 hypothetical protein [Metasolibacillus sp.]WPK13535.1 hypothetical protein R6U77_07610 [Lysinibacillus louembei]
MNDKLIALLLVTGSSLLALFFIFKQNFNLAVLCLTVMFTFSNLLRYRSFMRQGYVKEAKWMRNLAIFFGLATVAVIYILVTK